MKCVYFESDIDQFSVQNLLSIFIPYVYNEAYICDNCMKMCLLLKDYMCA